MIGSALATALLAWAGSAPPGEAFYVDASLDLGGRLLSWRFLDLDGDLERELVVAVRTPAGERELRVHRLRRERLEPEPEHRVPVLEDVLAWGVGEVRSEPGRELLFLTRGGAWSYSLTLSGYRGNVAPLVRDDLLYDLPDPRALPYWAYVLPAPGGDLVLLPGRGGYSIWGPAGEEGPYQSRAFFVAVEAEDDGGPGEDGTLRFDAPSTPFLEEDERTGAAALSESFRYRAPALVDYDGDGRLDLVLLQEEALEVHLGGPDGPSVEPTRVEALPESLQEDKQDSVDLRLVDLDGDGKLDLLAHVSDEIEGFENVEQRVIVHFQRGGKLIREQPDQLLRFEAAFLAVEVTDVDGDGHLDLALRKLELPSLVGTVTGLEFTFSYLVYLGERRGFARRPALKQEEKYDEDSVVALAANRELALDCDGDGIADLVEVDLQGRIAIRRLRRESSLLRGETWELEAAPWKLFEGAGTIQSLRVEDVNGDGLADVVSGGEDRLTVLLSVRRGGKR